MLYMTNLNLQRCPKEKMQYRIGKKELKFYPKYRKMLIVIFYMHFNSCLLHLELALIKAMTMDPNSKAVHRKTTTKCLRSDVNHRDGRSISVSLFFMCDPSVYKHSCERLLNSRARDNREFATI